MSKTRMWAGTTGYLSGDGWTGTIYWAARTIHIPPPPASHEWRAYPAASIDRLAAEAAKRAGICHVVDTDGLAVPDWSDPLIAVQAGGRRLLVNGRWFHALDACLSPHGPARAHTRPLSYDGVGVVGGVIWRTAAGQPLGVLLGCITRPAGEEATP